MATKEIEIADYEWIVVMGGIFAFFAAFGIGANDVANAFASSVGSKAITMKQAVFLAAIFEFGGAVLMGSHVTKTIRKGIADPGCFEDDPAVLMYGMMCVIFCVGCWLIAASSLELPVSTTHSAVGGIIGMTIASKGSDCVTWSEETDEFPYVKGVSAIVISWLLSPILSGICASFLFFVCRTLVLRSDNAFQRSLYFAPVLVAATLVINCYFIIYKGAKGLDLDETTMAEASGWSFGLGLGVTAVVSPILYKYLTEHAKKVQNNPQAVSTSEKLEEGCSPTIDSSPNDKEEIPLNEDPEAPIESLEEYPVKPVKEVELQVVAEPAKQKSKAGSVFDYVDGQMSKNLDSVVTDDAAVSKVHENAEVFDPLAEETFRYVQVFTAICDSFSHGANDVANSIGPFAAIYIIWRDGEVAKKAELGDDAFWILALGGAGIVVGLALYGYKIIHAIGIKLAKITPSRGFSIELGAAFIIIIGSRQGWPLSTTHCQVGATVGVGLLEQGVNGVNWVVFGKACFGWIITLIVVGFSAAILTAQGVYAPCV